MKRARTETLPVVVAKSKRPIEKAIKAIIQTVTTTQSNNTLFTAGNAQTYTGGTLSLSVSSVASVDAPAQMFWALVFVPESRQPSTMTITNNADLYLPEQDVLACGPITFWDGASASETTVQWTFSQKLKSMRKMKEGDSLSFLTLSNVASSFVLAATATLFFKQ